MKSIGCAWQKQGPEREAIHDWGMSIIQFEDSSGKPDWQVRPTGYLGIEPTHPVGGHLQAVCCVWNQRRGRDVTSNILLTASSQSYSSLVLLIIEQHGRCSSSQTAIRLYVPSRTINVQENQQVKIKTRLTLGREIIIKWLFLHCFVFSFIFVIINPQRLD